jgi:hypothetical protein
VLGDRDVRYIWGLPDEHRRSPVEAYMSGESSGKPDAWKLAPPVWGWGRGETPRPTPPRGAGGDRSRRLSNGQDGPNGRAMDHLLDHWMVAMVGPDVGPL